MGGGGRHTDLQHLLQVSGAGDPFVLIENLGDDPHYWLELWGVPPQGGPLPCTDETT